MDDIVREFLVESHEGLDQLDQDFVELEQNPGDKALLDNIFRCIHTIKGTCGFLGFAKLESVTHVGENLLSRLRDGLIEITPERTSALLALVDAVRSIMGHIESSGTEGEVDYSGLIDTLSRLQETRAEAAGGEGSAAPSKPEAEPAPEGAAEASAQPAPAPEGAAEAPAQPAPAPEGTAEASPQAAPASGGAAEAPAQPAPAPQDGAQAKPEVTAQTPAPEAKTEVPPEKPGPTPEVQAEVAAKPVPATEVPPAGRPADTPEPKAAKSPAPAKSGGGGGAGGKKAAEGHPVAESSIRVDVGLLDKLMNLVGELVLARNQVLQHTSQNQDATLSATSQRLNLITTELQEGVMKTRMQPIGNVWSKFPRVVRDLGVACGKSVSIEMEGKGTELDKTIIEAIKDPLTHVVRNAVDHGLETTEERLAAGKPAEGRLRLRAYHEGGQVNIEIADDGKGIDPEKILEKAISKNVISQDQGSRLSEREILQLIFFPGFSTAEKVTNVSGRGVGMDVVRSNIEKIGGTVDIQSTLGQGTTLKIKIPLTLAIIPALVVTCSQERFALPQVNLLELVRLEGEQARKGIEHVHGVPVYRLRGRLLPLVYLTETLGTPPKAKEDPEDEDVVNIVVLQADERNFGLVVDEINDTEEIVVKPLGKQLKNISAFAGATIMGDGTVALILDVLGLAQRSRVVNESRARAAADALLRTASGEAQTQTMLLFTVGSGRRVAIPLSMVSRLEEFSASMVEQAGDMEVVQYRGRILPLVRLSQLLGATSEIEPGQDLQVVVYSEGDSSVGLVVDRILDIVEESFTLQKCSGREGIFGSAVIQDKVTDLLDVQSAIRASTISLFEQATHMADARS
jgi:two-component system chemotaxis sensor kinase CheA